MALIGGHGARAPLPTLRPKYEAPNLMRRRGRGCRGVGFRCLAADAVEEGIQRHRDQSLSRMPDSSNGCRSCGKFLKKLGETSGIMPKPTDIATTNRL